MNLKAELDHQEQDRNQLIEKLSKDIEAITVQTQDLQKRIEDLSRQLTRDSDLTARISAKKTEKETRNAALLTLQAQLKLTKTLLEINKQIEQNDKKISSLLKYFRQKKQTEVNQSTPLGALEAEQAQKQARLDKIESHIENLESLRSKHSGLRKWFNDILQAIGFVQKPDKYKAKEAKRLQTELLVITKAIELEHQNKEPQELDTSTTEATLDPADISPTTQALKTQLVGIQKAIKDLNKALHATNKEISTTEKSRVKSEKLSAIEQNKNTLEQQLATCVTLLGEKTKLVKQLQDPERVKILQQLKDKLIEIDQKRNESIKTKHERHETRFFAAHLANEGTNVPANVAIAKIKAALEQFMRNIGEKSSEVKVISSITTVFTQLQMLADQAPHTVDKAKQEKELTDKLVSLINTLPPDNPIKAAQGNIIERFAESTQHPSAHADSHASTHKGKGHP